MLDIEALLAPTSDQPPCGPDLEYDPAWQELERLAQGKPEQQFGDTIIPAEEPDWPDVSKRAQALLERSKDVRSASLLAIACVKTDQYPGLVQGMQLIHGLLDRYWPEVHPLLDSSDNDDPTMRLNALAGLGDPQGLHRAVRNARLFRSRQHGELTVRQIEVTASKLPPRSDETVLSQSQIEQQLSAVMAEDASLAQTTSEAVAITRALARLLDEKVGSDRSVDLKPLLATLVTIDQVVAKVALALTGADAGAGAVLGGDAMEGGGGGGQGINAASGTIRHRGDVILLLDRISEFLERTEPTNPVPLILQRAKRIMSMNFLELMQDLAPNGVEQVRVVTGSATADGETPS
jgi:type VI secretion system protein ImpA